MLNIHDLEKRWLQYKIKSYIPYIVFALSTVFILTTGFFFLTKEETTKDISNTQTKQLDKNTVAANLQKKNDKNISTVVEKNNTTEAIIAKQAIYKPHQKNNIKNRSSIQEKKSNVLKPAMGFMKNLQNNTPHYYSKREQTYHQEKIQKKRTHISKQKAPKEEYINVHDKIEKAVKKPKPAIKVQKDSTEEEIEVENIDAINTKTTGHITIKRRESQNDIKDVIRRFQKNNNPALSLFVAKKYYELGDYTQAYNYALVTNKINNDIEESWLIFAKSLVKLGKKQQALKTLKEYINYSHSANAQVLFDEIQRGKFK